MKTFEVLTTCYVYIDPKRDITSHGLRSSEIHATLADSVRRNEIGELLWNLNFHKIDEKDIVPKEVTVDEPQVDKVEDN